MIGGRCDGGAFVHRVFGDSGTGRDCRDCFHRQLTDGEGVVCDVLHGKEPARECPALAEFIAFHQIPQYGVNRPPPRRGIFRQGFSP